MRLEQGYISARNWRSDNEANVRRERDEAKLTVTTTKDSVTGTGLPELCKTTGRNLEDVFLLFKWLALEMWV